MTMNKLSSLLSRGAGTVLLLALFVAPAARAETPEAFVQSLGDRATEILKTKDATTFKEREQKFRELLVEGFDMPTISQFVLGRYARTMSEQELKDYERLFVEFVVRVYAVRFDAYSGETFKVDRVLDTVDNDVIVRANIERSGGQPPVRTDWRVRVGDRGMKIIDVYVEGISMLNTQRQEFAAVIEQKGVQGLMDEMHARLAQDVSQGETQTAVQ